MKSIQKKLYKKNTKGTYRLVTEVKCDVCNSRTYPYPHLAVDSLQMECKVCKTLHTASRRGILDTVFSRERDREINKRKSDGTVTRVTRHGLCHLRLYKKWSNMMNRCYDPTHQNWEHYGGRGISVCPEWHDFSMFYWHMGESPAGMELDRIDNDGIYCPENCRFVHPEVNKGNRRKIHRRGTERKNIGWWTAFGLYENPYIYGPMPWKQTSLPARRAEAIERGWHKPKKNKPRYMGSE